MSNGIDQSKTNESEKQNKQKQKSHSRKLLRRNLSSNRPSCKNDAAKIQIIRIREEANKALKRLQPHFLRNPDSKINYSKPDS